MNKDNIKRNFSRYPGLYDDHAGIQRLAAGELVKYLPEDGVADILEIGCGTGIYTYFLKEKFKAAQLKALDISDRMIETARDKIKDEKIEFIVADAERIELEGKFDLVTSNAALQWFESFERAIKKYKNALREGGILIFSIFGPLTFWELRDVLKDALNKEISLSSGNFLKKEKIEEVLGAHFGKVDVSERIYKEEYPSMKELLKKIKYTGVRGDGINNAVSVWTRQMIKRLDELYKARFGAIEVSYQIFFCKATA